MLAVGNVPGAALAPLALPARTRSIRAVIHKPTSACASSRRRLRAAVSCPGTVARFPTPETRSRYHPAMSRYGRGTVGLCTVLTVALVGGAGPAFAGRTIQQCMDEAVTHGGEPPVCTKVNGSWVPSWPGDPGSSGGGVPGSFVLLAVLAALLAIGLTAWRVTTARNLARQSGMDPGLATQMTLLTEDGLDATYLAANLRNRQGGGSTASPVVPEPPRSGAAERLTELRSLMDQGLVTPTEYEDRRRAIIDTV
jgi:hypothetical protein